MHTLDGYRIIGWTSLEGASGAVHETVYLIEGFDKSTYCTFNHFEDGEVAILPF